MNNKTYAKAIENYKKISNYTETPVIPIYWALENRLEERFRGQFINVCKDKYNNDPENLTEEQLKPIREEFDRRATIFLAHKKHQVNLLFKFLYENADKIDMSKSKEFNVINKSSTWFYKTQGMSSKAYAKGRLIIDMAIINKHGFDAKIEQYEEGKYRLLANCTKTQFFAIELLETTKDDYKQFLKEVCRENGINPKVYFPLLEV